MYNNSKVTKSVRYALLLGASSTAFIGSSVAVAQEEGESVDRTERIQVTGSRIARPGEISPTPLTVISGEGLVDAGVVNVADLLHRMPNTLVGLSPETTNNQIFASGLNNTDLRGLGSNRTLVLVNGRRFVAGAPGSAAVDLNNIPTAMIERVEITTGGASAVYGSDAVAGVVNIITKRQFEGIEIDVATIRPFDSGGEEDFVSLTFGSSAGRANFVTNLSITRSGQLSANDRDYLRYAPLALQNPNFVGRGGDEPNNFFLWGYADQRLAQYNNTTDFFGSDGGRWTFDDAGNLRPFEFGEPLPYLRTDGGQAYYGPGDGYDFADNTWYRTPLDRINFTSNMHYEFNDRHSMNLEVNFSKTDAHGESSPAFLILNAGTQPIMPDNAFLPDDAAGLIGPNGATATYLASDFGNRRYMQDRYLARAAISFEGELTRDWYYDAYLTVGHVQSDTVWRGEIFEDRFYQAIDAITVDGEIQCRDTSGGCIPLNIFGRDNYTQEAYDWVSTDAMRRASIGQTVVGASVNGDIMELPAGFLQAAFSAEYREEKADTLPDPAMRNGLIFNNVSSPMSGDFNVSEVAAEFSIPLLADAPFAQQVNLDLAGRFMDYSTSGTDNAWKVGVNWEINDDWRVRVNRSKSVRAPNINELFAPPGQTFASLTDVCDTNPDRVAGLSADYVDQIQANCDAAGRPAGFEPPEGFYGVTRPGFNIGNADLNNETAKDWTVGFVYTPRALDNFSLTVDYWKFEITDLIQSLPGNTLINLCYRSSSLDNPYCPLIERDPDTFMITNFYQQPFNNAYSTTSGVDIEAAYRLPTDIGDFDFRLIGTYLEERITNATGIAEDEIVATGEQARPRWRHRLISTYRYNDFSAVLTMTYRSSTVLNNEWTPNQNNYNDLPSYTTFDFTTRYNVNNNLQVRLGVLNMFDRNPPRRPGAFSEGQYYDLLGRRATFGLNYSF